MKKLIIVLASVLVIAAVSSCKNGQKSNENQAAPAEVAAVADSTKCAACDSTKCAACDSTKCAACDSTKTCCKKAE